MIDLPQVLQVLATISAGGNGATSQEPSHGTSELEGTCMSKSVAVVHENIPVIEVAEAFTLDLLLADPTVADAIVNRIAPSVAIIDPAKTETLLARLIALGHLPKVEGK